MPIYEFECKDCKKTFSVTVTINEHDKNPLPMCQHCGSKNVEQKFSSVSVITAKKS